MRTSTRPMWSCPRCGRSFANRNQSHSCGVHDLDSHFANRPPQLRAIFDRLVAIARRCGDVTVLPEKSRIAFHVRMSFAAVTVRAKCLAGHLVLARRTPSAKFTRIDSLSRRNHVHHFRLTTLDDVDDEFVALFGQAYAVGCQKHLDR